MKNYSLLAFVIFISLQLFSCSKDYELGADKNEPDSSLPTEEEYATAEINPDYVPIDWETTKVLKCEPNNGTFSFQKTTSVKKLKIGSVIAIDVDTATYIAIVKKIAQNGDKVDIETKRGGLCNIFANTKFTLSTFGQDANVRSREDVYYPVKVFYRDEIGKVCELDLKDTRGIDPLTCNLWKLSYSLDNQVLFSGDHYKMYFKEADYSVGIDLNLVLDFGQRSLIESEGEALAQYKSKALEVEAYLEGEVSTKQILQLDISGKVSYDKGYDLWKHNIFKPISVKFMVAGVPILLKLNADLYRGVKLNAEGDISAYAGFSNTVIGKLGFKWKQSENSLNPIKSLDHQLDVVYPTVEGKGIIKEGKAWVFPRIRVIIDEMFGPSFDLKPYCRTSMSGGFREKLLSSDEDFVGLSVNHYAGVDVTAGLSLQFMNYEVKNYSIPDYNIVDKCLYTSPVNLRLLTSTSPKVQKGVTNTLRFGVYDNNALVNKEVPAFKQIVKFDGKGNVCSTNGKYGITDKGEVSVDWTPTSSSDVLTATLYNPDGTIFRQMEFSGKPETDIIGIEKVGCSYEQNGNVTFDYNVKTTLTTSKGVEEWGVYILDAFGEYTYYPARNGVLSDVVKLHLSYFKNELDVNYDRMIARKRIKMGTYMKCRSKDGTADVVYGNSQDVELVYDKKVNFKYTGASFVGVEYNEESLNDSITVGRDTKSTFKVSLEVSGSLFLNSLYSKNEGGYWSHGDVYHQVFDGGQTFEVDLYYEKGAGQGYTGNHMLRLYGETDEERIEAPNNLVFIYSGYYFNKAQITSPGYAFRDEISSEN